MLLDKDGFASGSTGDSAASVRRHLLEPRLHPAGPQERISSVLQRPVTCDRFFKSRSVEYLLPRRHTQLSLLFGVQATGTKLIIDEEAVYLVLFRLLRRRTGAVAHQMVLGILDFLSSLIDWVTEPPGTFDSEAPGWPELIFHPDHQVGPCASWFDRIAEEMIQIHGIGIGLG